MQFIPIPDQSRHRIATRSVAVSATSKDVIKALQEKGIYMTASQYSQAIRGVTRDPKSDLIVEETDKQLSEWEKEIEMRYKKKEITT